MKKVTKRCKDCEKWVEVSPEGHCTRCGRVLTPQRVQAPIAQVKGGTPKFY